MLQTIWEELPQEHITKAVANFTKRLTACMAANGGDFEYLLNINNSHGLFLYPPCMVGRVCRTHEFSPKCKSERVMDEWSGNVMHIEINDL